MHIIAALTKGRKKMEEGEKEKKGGRGKQGGGNRGGGEGGGGEKGGR